MSTKLLICDDSNMARKQVARSLPDRWDVDITFVCNGLEGLSAIKEGKGDVVLLDLNMPEMDGYQVLESILKDDLPAMVIVISGDIQPEAHKRVTELGALDFIKKPVSKDKLTKILDKFGLLANCTDPTVQAHSDKNSIPASHKLSAMEKPQSVAMVQEEDKDAKHIVLTTDMRDCYQEIANVAMGRAGDLLARLLDVFVVLPIPNVNFLEVSELSMALSAVEQNASTSGVCQGFIGAGISGEALLILTDSSFQDVASLMNYHDEIDKSSELELLMDLANVLISSCLSGVAEQLDMHFSQGHPVVLGQHRKISELIATNSQKWKKTLAIEISYNIENYDVKCDLLLLFTEESMLTLNNKISYLID
jgi:chemotaxis protein CheY-P-specific phosphatase CheC/DNA-binding NarL/FixJ family response regulator